VLSVHRGGEEAESRRAADTAAEASSWRSHASGSCDGGGLGGDSGWGAGCGGDVGSKWVAPTGNIALGWGLREAGACFRGARCAVCSFFSCPPPLLPPLSAAARGQSVAGAALAPLYSPCARSAFGWGSKPPSRSALAPAGSSPGLVLLPVAVLSNPHPVCRFKQHTRLQTRVGAVIVPAGRSAAVVEQRYALWGCAMHPQVM
jgi:hypothetical protein